MNNWATLLRPVLCSVFWPGLGSTHLNEIIRHVVEHLPIGWKSSIYLLPIITREQGSRQAVLIIYLINNYQHTSHNIFSVIML